MRALVPGAVLLVSLAFLTPRLARADDAEVTCKDGTKSKGGSGACSGHGGVDKGAKSTTPSESKSKSSKSSKSKSAEADEGESKSKSSKSSKTKPPEADEGEPKSKSSKSSKSKPAEASATEVTCKDGTKSKGGSGACSGHGGIDRGEGAATTAPAAAPAATSAPSRTPASSTAPASGEKGKPIAKCKDGSLSYSEHHTGTCSNHGGVAQWLDGT